MISTENRVETTRFSFQIEAAYGMSAASLSFGGGFRFPYPPRYLSLVFYADAPPDVLLDYGDGRVLDFGPLGFAVERREVLSVRPLRYTLFRAVFDGKELTVSRGEEKSGKEVLTSLGDADTF